MIDASLCLRRKCDDPHQTQIISKKEKMYCSKQLQKILLPRALTHVATLPREWIAVLLSSRTYGTRERQESYTYAQSTTVGCCRCVAAAALLLCCCHCCCGCC